MLEEYYIGTLELTREISQGELKRKLSNESSVSQHEHTAWRLTGGNIKQASSKVGLWQVSSRGFLPSRDPQRATKGPLLPLEMLVACLPVGISDGSVRECIAAKKEDILKATDAFESMSADELNRAHSLFSYLSFAYVRVKGPFIKPLTKLPRFLSKGWVKVSNMLGRQPMLDYCDCVLNNWERLDKTKKMTMENLRMLNRFTGVVDEEHFFKTHVIIESEAAPVINAIQKAFDCIERRDTSTLLVQFKALEMALFRLTRTCLPIMFASTKSEGALCDYFMFFHQLRPLIKTWVMTYEGEFNDKPKMFMGPSGAMSSILPCMDALLGIQMSSPKLSKMLRAFEAYIPRRHREFLEVLRKRTNARVYVSSLKVHEPHLVYSYNSIIDRVLDFRWSHFQFVKKYVIEQAPKGTRATGTGGTPAFTYLHQHIRDTEEARIYIDNKTPELHPKQQRHFVEIPKIDLKELKEPEGSVREWEKQREEFWEVGRKGFLCAFEPPRWTSKTKPKFCSVLVDLVRLLPSTCVAGGPFRQIVDSKKDDLKEFAGCIDSLSRVEAERACSLLAFIAAGYKADSGQYATIGKYAAINSAPQCVAKPLKTLAAKLDRPPRLSYSDLVLLNWRLDPELGEEKKCSSCLSDTGPEHDQSPNCRNKPRIRILHPVLAIPNEDWFWGMHVAIEGEASKCIRAISRGLRLMQQDNVVEVAGCLDELAHGLRALIQCHPDPYPHSSRAELVLWRRLKTFVAPKASLRDLSCLIYQGHSAILPSLFEYLGVKKGTHKLQAWREEAVKFMPTEHRKFLGVIKSSITARAYLKGKIAQMKIRAKIHDIAVLEVSFNKCIEQLLRFCSRRSQLVCRCVPQEAQWFREVEMKQEAEYLTKSHCALLIGMKLMPKDIGMNSFPKSVAANNHENLPPRFVKNRRKRNSDNSLTFKTNEPSSFHLRSASMEQGSEFIPSSGILPTRMSSDLTDRGLIGAEEEIDV
eukprot:CAMPEP_0167744344 /NCGR_PEP_ID=MMETSP0110_2-20121227/2537_1 /TAXON_ID=629695 /ORGANISM="Gymnochlora sp., Strain CCMP2014" /LENGTH=977 /DNA_ID=CAMNT_0007628851 /DNA_START=463 /DNA_END=3396 /DNA_ORIENTATION=-